jgi:hypothetical protein
VAVRVLKALEAAKLPVAVKAVKAVKEVKEAVEVKEVSRAVVSPCLMSGRQLKNNLLKPIFQIMSYHYTGACSSGPCAVLNHRLLIIICRYNR